jgi:hypothetical protein
LKVFGILKTFFQKGFKWVQGKALQVAEGKTFLKKLLIRRQKFLAILFILFYNIYIKKFGGKF